jgi:agmatinase
MAIKNPHFYSARNFGGILHELADYDNSKVVVLPVPYDGTATLKAGSRDGPMAIIEASRWLELYDEETGKNYSGIGICTLDELEVVDDAGKMVSRVREAVKTLLDDGKKIIMLGGEHSISSGSVQAHKEKYADLTVLHIDAHADLRDELAENKHNHGCAARRISEICPIVSVGIRSIGEEEAEFAKKSKNVKIFYAKDIQSGTEWMDEIVDTLGNNVYLTFDVDGLDPSIMPATGTPVPGGLLWYPVLELLRKVGSKKNVVGFDIVELMPLPGIQAPDILAAKLVYKLIGYFFSRQ